MAFSIDRRDGGQLLTLSGGVTIRHAQELAASLNRDLEFGAPMAVDTGHLEDVDTCILQLMCSLSKTFPALSFDGPSQVFLAAVDRCGLRRELPGLREMV